MKPWELFEEIKNTEYTKSGDSVDWAVKVYPDEKIVRLLFEESREDRDWKNNFDFPFKPYKQQENTLWFARGWGNAYKSCNDEIMDKLIKAYNEVKEQDYAVEVCGWSYGGAMALLAAEDFCYRTGCLPGVVTFGAPKPLWGNKTKKYVASCLSYCFQYSHVNDFVTVCIPLPGYKLVNKVKVGKNFCLFKYFKTAEYHCSYGDKSLYE